MNVTSAEAVGLILGYHKWYRPPGCGKKYSKAELSSGLLEFLRVSGGKLEYTGELFRSSGTRPALAPPSDVDKSVFDKMTVVKLMELCTTYDAYYTLTASPARNKVGENRPLIDGAMEFSQGQWRDKRPRFSVALTGYVKGFQAPAMAETLEKPPPLPRLPPELPIPLQEEEVPPTPKPKPQPIPLPIPLQEEEEDDVVQETEAERGAKLRAEAKQLEENNKKRQAEDARAFATIDAMNQSADLRANEERAKCRESLIRSDGAEDYLRRLENLLSYSKAAEEKEKHPKGDMADWLMEVSEINDKIRERGNNLCLADKIGFMFKGEKLYPRWGEPMYPEWVDPMERAKPGHAERQEAKSKARRAEWYTRLEIAIDLMKNKVHGVAKPKPKPKPEPEKSIAEMFPLDETDEEMDALFKRTRQYLKREWLPSWKRMSRDKVYGPIIDELEDALREAEGVDVKNDDAMEASYLRMASGLHSFEEAPSLAQRAR